MRILDIIGRIVSILVGLATLTKKSKSYIRWSKEKTVKDPSASLPAPDGSYPSSGSPNKSIY